MKKSILALFLLISSITYAQYPITTLKSGTNSFLINGASYPLNSVVITVNPDTFSIGLQATGLTGSQSVISGGKTISSYVRATGVPFASYSALIAWHDSFMVSNTPSASGSTSITGNVGGYTSICAVTPTITASIYTAGYVMGGVQTLTNAMRITNGTGALISLIGNDKGNQKSAMTIFIYSQNPSNGTYTDRAAFSPNATDQGYLISKISIASADWTSEGSQATVIKNLYAAGVKATNSGTNLYAIIITDGTPTPASTSDLKFSFGFIQD